MSGRCPRRAPAKQILVDNTAKASKLRFDDITKNLNYSIYTESRLRVRIITNLVVGWFITETISWHQLFSGRFFVTLKGTGGREGRGQGDINDWIVLSQAITVKESVIVMTLCVLLYHIKIKIIKQTG